MAPGYQEFFRRSIKEPVTFRAEEGGGLHWNRKWDRVMICDNPPFSRWFVGGEANLCYNAVDRHLADRAEQKAIVWISSELGKSREREPGDLSTHEDPAAIEGVGKAIKSGGPA